MKVIDLIIDEKQRFIPDVPIELKKSNIIVIEWFFIIMMHNNVFDSGGLRFDVMFFNIKI